MAYLHTQGIGIVTASIVSLIVVRSFKHKIENESVLYLDYAWRIIIGLGCGPAIATIYLRYRCCVELGLGSG